MYQAIKEEAWLGNLLLPKYGLVDLTFGNLSVYDPEKGVFAIKPSGVPYDCLTVGDMVVVDLDGKKVEGDLRPSSDMYTHLYLYQHFPSIRSVAHTHSKFATIFAQAAQEIPCLGTTHADYFRGPIPVTRPMTPEEISGNYEWETGKVIVERFSSLNPEQFPGVLVCYHGPFVWGKSGEQAAEISLIMERVAEMTFYTWLMKGEVTNLPSVLIDRHFLRKHGTHAYYGQKST